MATFGENLRRERELRGITLPELANATKISLRHLDALEKDQFDRLPGGVFNRGFVRAVTHYMNMDQRHWVGEYVRAAHEEPEVQARYAPPRKAGPAGSVRRGMWSFALLLVLFGAGAYLIHEVWLRRAAEASPPVVTSAQAVSQSRSAPNSPAPVSPAANAGAPAAGPLALAATPAPIPTAPSGPPAELRLQVDVLDEAWVSVAVDGQPAYRGLMKPGDSQTFRGSSRIDLTTGNASAVVLTLNGETLAPLGNPGERKNVVLTAKDLKHSTP